MTNTPHILLHRVLQRRWLVLGISLLAVLAAAAVSLGQETTYTAKAALMVVSQGRAPEQDAILTQGYVNFFNDPQYQAKLRDQAGAAPDVTLLAEGVAASPMLYISATSRNAGDVESTVGRMAEAFQREINDRMQAKRDAAIEAVRKPFEDIRAGSGVIPEQALIQMQDRISAINSDNTNELQVLRLDSAVEASAPNTLRLLAVALLGGLALGVVVALALGAVSRRLEDEHDVAIKAGLRTLATIADAGAPGPTGERTIDVQRLTNLIALSVPRPGVVAVASARHTLTAGDLTRAIGSLRASQGVRTLVIDATLPPTDRTTSGRPDLAGPIVGCKVVGLGEVSGGDGMLDPERIKTALDKLEGLADLLLVVAPPLLDDIGGQAICAAADRTLIVVDQGVSRSHDVRETARLIADVKGRVMGVVIVKSSGRRWRTKRAGVPTSQPSVSASASVAPTQPRPQPDRVAPPRPQITPQPQTVPATGRGPEPVLPPAYRPTSAVKPLPPRQKPRPPSAPNPDPATVRLMVPQSAPEPPRPASETPQLASEPPQSALKITPEPAPEVTSEPASASTPDPTPETKPTTTSTSDPTPETKPASASTPTAVEAAAVSPASEPDAGSTPVDERQPANVDEEKPPTVEREPQPSRR